MINISQITTSKQKNSPVSIEKAKKHSGIYEIIHGIEPKCYMINYLSVQYYVCPYMKTFCKFDEYLWGNYKFQKLDNFKINVEFES